MDRVDYVRGGTQRETYSEQEVMRWDCPLCGSSSEKLLKVERGVLGIVACTQCTLMRTNPRLQAPHEVYHGALETYEEEFRMVVQHNRPHHRDPNYRRILKTLKALKPSGNFLDVGTNTGSFLRLARNQGWNLVGVEPSPHLAALARKWWGLNILDGFLEEVPLAPKSFDLVTMTDVFEHVVNPAEILAATRRVIKDDGILFIKVPNGRFSKLKFQIRKLFRRSLADDFDSYEHVCHYSYKTLKAMLEKNGWSIHQIYAEAPIQLPVWHKYVGHYYQHQSPFALSWKTNLARAILFRASQLEQRLVGEVGPFAPNLGCIARPQR